ncbi:16S rRNA (guanine(966)-N(2))-methyltransferase RsmD [Barrientosiimonas marina]|uniref:16S rRNA (Guanine(966)-N(2))-methyltransferase RsmD n=1 Tax=Lentibacillus kimchii TaxID=1542911 RepID=A0ABW2USU0_9BACI
MRVISGSHKGRSLESVPGSVTRPTSDKIKESVFQVMGPFFEGGLCLDLFAGSGALGIEALSRGVSNALFVDAYPKAIRTIHNNMRKLKLDDRTEIFRTDAFRALNAIAKRDLQFDLILLDPPYQKVNYEKLLDRISSLQLLKPNGFLYCEHDASKLLSGQVNHLATMKQETYNGTTGVTIFQGN